MNSGRSRAWSLVLVATMLLLAASETMAQEEKPAQEETVVEGGSADERPLILDEIVVTAEKREENLQRVPLSVTAYSATRIEEAGIESPEDFIALTPNVTIANSFTVGNSFVTIRGISQINNSDPSVAVVVDGVYQGNQKQLTQELFDVERIEVLKGPQGALYGRNSLGGAINVITKPPSQELEGYVKASAGSGASYGLSAAVSRALLRDRLLFRLAGSYKDSDGLIENVFLGREADRYQDLTGRFELKWLPAAGAEIDLRLALSDTEGGAVLYSIFPTDGFANDFSFPPDENILGLSDREMEEWTLRAVWQTGAAVVTSITGLSEVTEIYRGDGDFSNPGRDIFFPFGQLGQGQDLDVRLLSQEIRLASPDDRRLRWIAGGYLLATDRELISRGFFDTDGTIEGFFPFVTLAEDNDNDAYAFFGQLDYELNDRWRIAAALRFDEDERRQTDLMTGLERRAKFDAWQPKVTVTYQASERLMAYLNLSSGFRSGGFNAPTAVPEIFKKETSDNLEIGWKATLAGGRLRLNGAAYLTAVDDAQYFLFDFFRATQIIENIRDAEMRGLELDLFARAARGWDVYAALGWNDSEIQDFDGSGRFIGNQTPYNTRSTFNLGTRYSRPLGDGLLAVGSLDLELRGKQYWHPDNLDVQDAIQLLNLRLGIEGELWAVTAWAKNLTDEAYYVEYADASWVGNPSGNDIGHLGKPRSYGIEVRRSF